MSVSDEAQKEMKLAIEHLRKELANIRTGRASPAILDSVLIEVYGTQMRLKDVASITAPEPRQLLVTPFDANNVDLVGKAIEKANLGFQTVVDGNVVRILVPPMDEAMRKEMVKQSKRKTEEAKVSIRNIRRKCNETVRKQKADGDVTEDIQKKEEKAIQKATDDFCVESDKLAAKKEEEILQI